MAKLVLGRPVTAAPDERGLLIEEQGRPDPNAVGVNTGPLDDLDLALELRGLQPGQEIDVAEGDAPVAELPIGTPATAAPDTAGEAGVSFETTGITSITNPEEGTATARGQHRSRRREEAAEFHAMQTPFSEREAQIKEQLNQGNLTAAERANLSSELADLQNQKREMLKQEKDRQQEIAGAEPFAWRTQQDIQNAIEQNQIRLNRLNSYANTEINASEAARNFYNGRTEWYRAASEVDASTVLANHNNTGTPYNSTIEMLTAKSGVEDDVIHTNIAYIGLSAAMMAAMAGKSVEGTDPDSINQEYLEGPIDWFTPAEGDILDEKKNQKPTPEQMYRMIGTRMIQAGKRQDVHYDASALELGQDVFHDAARAGLATIMSQKNKKTGEIETVVVFDPDFAIKQAQAGQILLPAVLKRAPRTPGKITGYEGKMGDVIDRVSGSVPKGTGLDVISQSAQTAAVIMQHSPTEYQGYEVSIVNIVNELAEHQGAPEDVRKLAREAIGKTGDNPEAIEQNTLRVNKSLELIDANHSEGATLFPRYSIGVNANRKYNQTRDANPTMFKEQREAARGPAIHHSDEMMKTRPEIKEDQMFNLLEKANKKDQKLTKGEMDKMHYWGVLYSMGSILQPVFNGDPVRQVQKAEQRLEAWAQVGEQLMSILLPGNPNPTLEEINAARVGFGERVGLEQVDPDTLATIVDVLKNFERGTWGYAMTAYLNAAIHQRGVKEGKGYQSRSINQLDYQAAGLGFQATQAGAADVVSSIGVYTEIDPFTGEEVINVGPRHLYMDSTLKSIAPMLDSVEMKEEAPALAALFKAYGMDNSDPKKGDGFIKKWGKIPMMVTPYGKHPATHQEAVINFLDGHPEFRDEALAIYHKKGLQLGDLVEDLAAVHENALKDLFGGDLMTTLYSIDAINSIFAMGGESVKIPVSVDGGSIVTGMDKDIMHENAVEMNGHALPIATGMVEYDPTADRGFKRFKKVMDDGTIRYDDYPTKLMTAAKDSILAALGHRSESIALDEAIKYAAKVYKGQGIMPFHHNMYDSLSFSGESSLFFWYGMNVLGRDKAITWDQRGDIEKAARAQLAETQKTLKAQQTVNLSYPNTQFGAIGYKLDEKYAQLYNHVESLKGTPKDKWSDWDILQHKRFEALVAQGKRLGWTPPDMVDDPSGTVYQERRRGKRKVLKTAGRSLPVVTGDQAASLFNLYHTVNDSMGTLRKWIAGKRKSDYDKLMKKISSHKGKKTYWARSVTQ